MNYGFINAWPCLLFVFLVEFLCDDLRQTSGRHVSCLIRPGSILCISSTVIVLLKCLMEGSKLVAVRRHLYVPEKR